MNIRKWTGIVPVSYTHLDVYKRQAEYQADDQPHRGPLHQSGQNDRQVHRGGA